MKGDSYQKQLFTHAFLKYVHFGKNHSLQDGVSLNTKTITVIIILVVNVIVFLTITMESRRPNTNSLRMFSIQLFGIMEFPGYGCNNSLCMNQIIMTFLMENV